jgi:hypothetical protein
MASMLSSRPARNMLRVAIARAIREARHLAAPCRLAGDRPCHLFLVRPQPQSFGAAPRRRRHALTVVWLGGRRVRIRVTGGATGAFSASLRVEPARWAPDTRDARRRCARLVLHRQPPSPDRETGRCPETANRGLLSCERTRARPLLRFGLDAVAAKELGRRYVGIELEGAHCRTASRRLQTSDGSAP